MSGLCNTISTRNFGAQLEHNISEIHIAQVDISSELFSKSCCGCIRICKRGLNFAYNLTKNLLDPSKNTKFMIVTVQQELGVIQLQCAIKCVKET